MDKNSEAQYEEVFSQNTIDQLPDPLIEVPDIPVGPVHSVKDHHPTRRYVSTGFTLIGYTFALQLALHLMTFILNGLAYHLLDPASLGLVNVRLGLFYTTLIFVARDAFRRACLSRGGELITEAAVGDSKQSGCCANTRHRLRDLLDLSWMIFPIGVVLSVVLLIIWIFILPSPASLAVKYGESQIQLDTIQFRYIICLLVYTASGLFELATEPFLLVCQLTHLVRERIVIEAISNLARALGIVVAVFTVSQEYAIYALALPQLLHGTTLFVSYLVYFDRVLHTEQNSCISQMTGLKTLWDIFPNIMSYSVDQPALHLAKSLFSQGLCKQLLTEGERYLISAFHLLSFTDQGIYDVISNIASIATRLLFLPMEESCHFVFNQCLIRNLPPSEQNQLKLDSVFRMFRTVLRACSLVAWIGFTFAQANSCLLLSVYVGSSFANNSTATSLLRLCSGYVLLLAWNGSTEAFLNAAMSSQQVVDHNRRLVAFSVLFLSANWILVPRLGAHGFIVANCINMTCRIAYSCFYIKRFTLAISQNSSIERKSESNRPCIDHRLALTQLMLPSMNEWIVLLTSLVITMASEWFFCCTYGFLWSSLHATITILALIGTMYIVCRDETELLHTLQREVFHKKLA